MTPQAPFPFLWGCRKGPFSVPLCWVGQKFIQVLSYDVTENPKRTFCYPIVGCSYVTPCGQWHWKAVTSCFQGGPCEFSSSPSYTLSFLICGPHMENWWGLRAPGDGGTTEWKEQTHTHTHTHTLTHSCTPHMHTHKHRHAYTYTHHTCMLACKCMHAQLLTYICMYTDSHITCEYLHACSHIHTPAHLHKYTLRNTHTHTHTLAITASPPLDLHMSSKQPPCVQPWGWSCGPQLGLH